MPRRARVGSAIAAAASAGAAGVARRALVRRYGVPAARRGAGTPPQGAGIRAVALPTTSGVELRALVLEGDGRRGSAVVLHGWGGSAIDMLPVGGLLREEGFDVVLLDAAGHGGSGDVVLTSMPRFAEDLSEALRWWREVSSLSRQRLVLVGHSVGAGACLLTARSRSDVDAVVALAGLADPREVMSRLLAGAGLPRALLRPALRVVEHLIGHRFSSFSPNQVVRDLTIPLLVVHGEQDSTVPVSHARLLAGSAPSAQLVVLPGVGHSDVAAVASLATPLRTFLAQLP